MTTICSAEQPHWARRNDHSCFGKLSTVLVETFLLGELARQLAFTDQPVRLYHYRDRDQYEVDAVLESASGEVVACEVKAAETVRSEDFRGIQRLARRIGDQLVAGIVLYAGGQPLPFGDRLRAWPISTLWTLDPDAGFVRET